MAERLIDLQKRLRGKTPKGYHVISQGWSTKGEAQASAKRMRATGYKVRVIKDGKWYRLAMK